MSNENETQRADMDRVYTVSVGGHLLSASNPYDLTVAVRDYVNQLARDALKAIYDEVMSDDTEEAEA